MRSSRVVLSFFALLMLLYTGWRSYDYIGGSLQGIDQTTRFVVSVAFLAFSEIGLLLWLHVGRPGSTTDTQEATATTLIWLDFFGILMLGLGDLLRHNTMYVVDMSYLDPVLFISPWLLVAANLGAYLIYTMADSDEQLGREERRLDHAETSVEMQARREAVKEIRTNREALGKELAPSYYNDIRSRVTGRTAKRFAKKAAAPFAINGNTYQQETEQLPEPNPTPARKQPKQ